MSEDVFLLSLVTLAGRRGRRFVLKEEEATGVLDKWLCLLAGVDSVTLHNGLITSNQARKLRMAARALNSLPIYVERSSDGTWKPEGVEPDF